MIVLRGTDFRKDITNIYNLFMNDNLQCMFHAAMEISNIGEFEAWLRESIARNFQKFRVITTEEDEFVGFVYSYDYSPSDMHCKICAAVEEAYQETGMGAAATLLFIDSLFRYYPLRKIYMTVYEYNKQSLISNKDAGFTEVARLQDYRYYDGEYWDLFYLSITRKDFYSDHADILKTMYERNKP